GLVARDDLNRRVVLGFSGTTDPIALLQSLDASLAPWPADVPGSRVYSGFLASYLSVVGQFLPPLEAAMAGDCKGYQVFVVGHSQGGAHAMFAAVDLKRRHPDWNIAAYPSGKPRVGNDGWARYANSLGMPIRRLVAKSDQVPHLPDRSQGYVHETGEVWITPSGSWVQCEAFDNSVGEDPACSASVP
ncbi:alpha/beta-hydrolase, partial [Ramicandelaber brevisporus]